MRRWRCVSRRTFGPSRCAASACARWISSLRVRRIRWTYSRTRSAARARRLDITLDNLRARYGKTCVLRGRACFDPALGLVQREEHAFLRK